jgi:RND family efflux transporter MFP subunit
MAVRKNILISVIFRAIIVVFCLGAALGLFQYLVSTAPQPLPSELMSAVPRVLVMRAQPMDVQRQWEGYGTAQAMDSANVPSRITSTVVGRPDEIRPGRTVSRGQLLVKLDDSDFVRQVEISAQAIGDIEAQLARLDVEERSWTARAALAAEDAKLARADLQRVQDAMARGAAMQRELDQAQQALNTAAQTEVATREEVDKIAPRRASLKAQLSQEQASLRLANQNVERSQIASPLNGVLQTVDVEVGESITAGQRVARVVSLDRIEVPIVLSAAARPFISVGDHAMLFSEGVNAAQWSARVARIAPENEHATRTMRVFVEVENQTASAPAPGQFVQGRVASAQSERRWIVPRRAIDQDRVRLVVDNQIVSRAVETDFSMEREFPEFNLPDLQWTVLKSPLPAGALVVVDGARSLSEGSSVEPVAANANDDQITARASATAPPVDSEEAEP